jgi:Protein of unknown function (DUF3043)
VKLRRTPAEPEPVPAVHAEQIDHGPDRRSAPKGRATPKRRDTAPKKQPLAAPRTNKEATQWRKQQAAQARASTRGNARGTSAKMTTKEYREAIKRGDPAVLPKRDRGPARELARDWVDAHRLFANYFLLMIPLLLIGSRFRAISFVTPAVVIGFFLECYVSGRRIRSIAVSRLGEVRDGTWMLGLYAGQRAYLPRRFRSPRPRFQIGDKI